MAGHADELVDKVVFNVDTASCAVYWPRFASMAGGRGIRSCLSVPVMVGGRATGALSLYSHKHEAFSGYEHEGVAVGAMAATALSDPSLDHHRLIRQGHRAPAGGLTTEEHR